MVKDLGKLEVYLKSGIANLKKRLQKNIKRFFRASKVSMKKISKNTSRIENFQENQLLEKEAFKK